MHRRGHIGMAMPTYTPVGFVLLQERQLGLALLSLLGVLIIEPLPDNDQWIPGLRHRGTSHSLLAALVVGGVIGAVGWVVGDRVTVLFANALASLDTAAVGIFAGLFQGTAEELRSLDGPALATFGFAVGVSGVLVHLLADAITVAGVRPLLPLSQWRLSLSSIRADSPLANNGLFGLGVLALAVVFLVTAPGVGIGLSPVDVAAGQSQNTTNVSVELANQTTNGSTVTISRARLPEGGFVVLHGPSFSSVGVLDRSAIAVSEPLSGGIHRNVTLSVSSGVPGGYQNQSALNGTGNYTAIAYRDSDGNDRFGYVTSGGNVDAPYTIGSGSSERLASSTARIIVSGTRGDPNATTPDGQASIVFEDQQTNGSNLTVQSVTLPDGGWVVVHNASYTPPQSNPLTSTVGISSYLDAGEHQNVTVELLNGTVARNQTLIARPSMDTNDDQRYDYIRSQGFQDVGYISGSQVLTDRAQVTVPANAAPTSSTASGATDASTSAVTATTTATATSSQTETSAATTTSESGGGSDLLGAVSSFLGPLLVVGVVVSVAYVWTRR